MNKYDSLTFRRHIEDKTLKLNEVVGKPCEEQLRDHECRNQ